MKVEFLKNLGKRKATQNSKYESLFGLFKCHCGKEFESYLRLSDMQPSQATSCGCNQLKKISKLNRKHGESTSNLYRVRNSMIQRCINKKNKAYVNYGGRGIKVCDEWLNSYESFRDFMLSIGYKENVEIDRINNDGNYEPNNVRLSNRSMQCQNTRLHKTNTSGYRGVSRASATTWEARIWANNKKIWLGHYKTKEDAAIAYDNYVIINKTNHPLNILQKDN